MWVVGVDLSTKKIALVVTNGKRIRWLEIVSGLKPASARRLEMFDALGEALHERWLKEVDAVHIEAITFIRSGKNELDMSKVQGGIEYAYAYLGVPCYLHNNMKVKATFGLNRKDKEAVVKFVNEKFGVEVPSSDVADAAITALHGMAQDA